MKPTYLLALALAPAVVHADPAPPPLPIAVHGAIDPALVASSVASELARPVLPTEDCRAGCLAITVAGGRATVTFHAGDGAPRERTIQLPRDAAQRPLVIALLAGNLVRDEADALLVDDAARDASPTPIAVAAPPPDAPPAPPAVAAPPPDAPPAPPAVAAPPSPPDAPPSFVIATPPMGVVAPRTLAPSRHFSPFALALVPGVSTDLLDLQRAHAISIGLVAESSSQVSGLALSGAVDVAGQVDGAQIAGAVGVASTLRGAQVSGAAAVAGEITGVQVAGAAAVSVHTRGTQIAGATTIARELAGTQIAGGVAVAGASSGTQIAGGVAVAGASSGTQIAGGVAIAQQFAGTQIAGGVTITDHLAGVQIAPINIARRNDGVQIGVINIGGGPDGDAFGLINIVPGGRTDLEAAIDSDRTGTLLFRHGGRHWHNVYGIGAQQVDSAAGMPNDDVWMVGLGVGPSFHLASLPTDLDAIAWQVGHGSEVDDHLSLLAQARLTTSIPLGRAALIVGGAINTYVTTDARSPLAIARTTGDSMTSDVRVRVWPTAFVGVRL